MGLAAYLVVRWPIGRILIEHTLPEIIVKEGRLFCNNYYRPNYPSTTPTTNYVTPRLLEDARVRRAVV